MTNKKYLVIVALALVGVLVFWGLFRHAKTEADGADNPEHAGAPVAAVVKVGHDSMRGLAPRFMPMSGGTRAG